jgi:protein tyrosine phosphatase
MFSCLKPLIDRVLEKRNFVRPSGKRQSERSTEFETHDAHRMGKDSHLIASKAPKDGNLRSFAEEMFFRREKPITQVVALIDEAALPDQESDFYDCMDYCVTPGKREWAGYTFDVVPESKGDFGQVALRDVVKSKTTVSKSNTEKAVSFSTTVIPLADKHYFELSDKTTTLNETIWGIYKISQKEDVVVHCQAGLNRTGFFILTLEILKNYDTIFASKNAAEISQNIFGILEGMRHIRAGMMNNEAQYKAAIRNAHVLHQHGLKKGYIRVPVEEKKDEPKEAVDLRYTQRISLMR